MKLLVLGATGLVGSHVLDLAIADGRIHEVIAPVRRPLPERPGLLAPRVDFDLLPARGRRLVARRRRHLCARHHHVPWGRCCRGNDEQRRVDQTFHRGRCPPAWRPFEHCCSVDNVSGCCIVYNMKRKSRLVIQGTSKAGRRRVCRPADLGGLAYVVGGECVLRYDNEAGKGDHKHVRNVEVAYTFTTLDQLIEDFWADVAQL